MWDAAQYERFRGERSRPFFDMLSRIPDRSYRTIVDLGCGTGDLTAALADHWPESHVTGVDLSEEMLVPAREREEPGRLEFIRGDLATWTPASPAELIVSSAAFQWVPDHERLIGHVASSLARGGVLAVQMPSNFGAPSHTLLDEVEAAGPWAERLRGRRRHDMVLPIARYIDLAGSHGLRMDAWETTYYHLLEGDDPVLEWMKGTALRPILAALGGPEREEFLGLYGRKLREAYPQTSAGTLFPFRRIFFVARKG